MSSSVVTQPRAARRRTPGLLAHQVRYDWLSFIRNRQARFFTLALPVLFLVILCALFGNGSVRVPGGTVKESTYYVPGLVGLGLIQAAFASLVLAVTVQRETGILKRRRATPLPAGVLIGGRALTAVGTALWIAVVLIVIGAAAYGARVPSRTVPALITTIVVGALAFCTLGYALVSAIHSADSAMPVVQAILLPLYFISGIFVPTENIPHWLDVLARIFPVRHLQAALLKAFNPHTVGAGFAWHDLLVLVIWGAVGLAIAVTRFA